MTDLSITLTAAEAREVREAILDTRAPWSPILDRVTKRIQSTLDGEPVTTPAVVEVEAIVEALRDAHRHDSAADAVEYVSDLVGWSAEDDPDLYPPCPTCGAQGPDQSCVEYIDGRQTLVDDHAERG